jgi:hypothetical protein
MKRFASIFVMLAMLGSLTGIAVSPHGQAVVAQDKPADKPKAARKYPRGFKVNAALQAKLHAAALKRQGERVKLLPRVTVASFDCRSLGIVPAIKDQGQCGDCYIFSASSVCTSAFMKAGYVQQMATGLSEQYSLDCHSEFGGCDGGDEAQVIDFCKSTGLPTDADYGVAYTAAPGNCAFKPGTKLWQIADYGYCTPTQQTGIASTQNIKDCMVQYGPISVAVAANDDWDAYTGGVMPNPPLTPADVNHAIVLVGWDDTKGGGAWLARNSWGKAWGEQGYAWVPYGAYQIGTEAIWATATALPPPPPPTPDPPVPGSNPVVSVTLTFKDGSTQTIPAPGPPTPQPNQDQIKQILDTLSQQKATLDQLQKDMADFRANAWGVNKKTDGAKAPPR